MTRDEAPITAMMLTVQFTPPVQLPNPLQLAKLYALFETELPVFDQIDRAGLMPLNPATMLGPPLMIGGPRSRFSTADGRFNLLFQEDRFSFNWNRVVPLSHASGYPGFSAILGQAEGFWSRLREAFLAQSGVPVEPAVGEIAYTDHFDMGRMSRLSDVFACVNPAFDADVSVLNATWIEPGVLPGMTQTGIVAPVQTGWQESAAQMQVVSRFLIPGGWTDLGDIFRTSHEALLASFQRLISPAFRPI